MKDPARIIISEKLGITLADIIGVVVITALISSIFFIVK